MLDNPAPNKAGWKVAEWCSAAAIGRTMYYALPPELQPRYIKIGTARIITESPADFLRRYENAQRAKAAL